VGTCVGVGGGGEVGVLVAGADVGVLVAGAEVGGLVGGRDVARETESVGVDWTGPQPATRARTRNRTMRRLGAFMQSPSLSVECRPGRLSRPSRDAIRGGSVHTIGITLELAETFRWVRRGPAAWRPAPRTGPGADSQRDCSPAFGNWAPDQMENRPVGEGTDWPDGRCRRWEQCIYWWHGMACWAGAGGPVTRATGGL
jgi:hypothetical protein